MILVNLPCAVYYGVNFMRAVLIQWILNGLLFMWLYNESLNYMLPLVVFLALLVVMTLTLYVSAQQQQRGVQIT